MARGRVYLAGRVVLLPWPLERLCRGAGWALVLLRKDLQDGDALGWGSDVPTKSLALWAEGWLWTERVRGQALLNKEQGYSWWLLHTTGCILLTFPSPLPCPRGRLFALPWTRQKAEVESSFILEVLSKSSSSLTD